MIGHLKSSLMFTSCFAIFSFCVAFKRKVHFVPCAYMYCFHLYLCTGGAFLLSEQCAQAEFRFKLSN